MLKRKEILLCISATLREGMKRLKMAKHKEASAPYEGRRIDEKMNAGLRAYLDKKER